MRHSRQNAAFLWPTNPQSRSLLTLGSRRPSSRWSAPAVKILHRSRALPRHSTSLHRGHSELSGFHSTTTIRKSGDLAPNSLIAGRGVGVGLTTPPDFHSEGSGYFPPTLLQLGGNNLARAEKILPVQKTSPIFSGERRMHSGGVRKFLPPPLSKCSVSREHFIGSILPRPKSSPSSVYGAGGASQASQALG